MIAPPTDQISITSRFNSHKRGENGVFLPKNRKKVLFFARNEGTIYSGKDTVILKLRGIYCIRFFNTEMK